MYYVESFFNGKPLFLTETGCFTADNMNARPFNTKEEALAAINRHPLSNRTCYGADAEILRHLHIQED